MSGYGHRCPTCSYYSSNFERIRVHAIACAERKAARQAKKRKRVDNQKPPA